MKSAQSFSELYAQVSARKVPFLIVFFLIVFVSYGALYIVDVVPEQEESPATEVAEGTTAVKEPDSRLFADWDTDDDWQNEVITGEATLPLSISFDALNRTVPVLNPTSNNIEVLDDALLRGVVRHPDSTDYSEPGNVFILGHSSYLPNVFNKNFQAFNGLQELTWGDTIRVKTADTEYVYRVDHVYKAKASELTVPVTKGEHKLTLATCNSFASKDDRFIVEASLVSTRAL